MCMFEACIGMVSRSLEKMMLIAIGLSTAVIIGVPVLLHAIDTMTTTQRFQAADLAAQRILNATRLIDIGELNETTIQVQIPEGFAMTVDNNGYSLIMTLNLGDQPPGNNAMWSETFSHPIALNESPEAGTLVMIFHMESGVIQINYTFITN